MKTSEKLKDCLIGMLEIGRLMDATERLPMLLEQGRLSLEELKEVVEMETKLNNPICHQGHSDYPLTLWDCPTCVQIEKKKLSICDLCDEPAEYRQCQECMNDKFIGSHTDEEYRKLETFAKNADETVEKLIKEKHALHDNLLASTSNAVQLGIQLEALQQQVERLEAGFIYTSSTGRELLVRIWGNEPWIFYKHPDGQWISMAKAGYALEGSDNETKNEIPPKVGREDVEHPHPQT